MLSVYMLYSKKIVMLTDIHYICFVPGIICEQI